MRRHLVQNTRPIPTETPEKGTYSRIAPGLCLITSGITHKNPLPVLMTH
jgi:hypothetical protein